MAAPGPGTEAQVGGTSGGRGFHPAVRLVTDEGGVEREKGRGLPSGLATAGGGRGLLVGGAERGMWLMGGATRGGASLEPRDWLSAWWAVLREGVGLTNGGGSERRRGFCEPMGLAAVCGGRGLMVLSEGGASIEPRDWILQTVGVAPIARG